MNAKESYATNSDPMTNTQSQQRREQADKERARGHRRLAIYAASTVLAALGVVEVVKSAADAVGGNIRGGQVTNMLSQPSEVVAGEYAAGSFKAGEVTPLTINKQDFTSNAARDIAREGLDARAVEDRMVDQIGETAEPGERVFIQTDNIDPKILEQPPQGPQQPK